MCKELLPMLSSCPTAVNIKMEQLLLMRFMPVIIQISLVNQHALVYVC